MDDHIRIEWRQSRRDNLFIVIAERRDGKWEFFERSSWEVRWYLRVASFELVAQLAVEEMGDYNDNMSVLTRARQELAEGQEEIACQRLLRLQAHIYMTKDKQSAVHLLPDVEKLLRGMGYQSLSTFGVYSPN